jgi:hypothetical protein
MIAVQPMARLKSRHLILVGVALVILAIFLWLMSMTHNDLYGIWIGFYMLVLPYLLIGGAAFCVRAGVRTRPSISYGSILVGVALLLLACYVLADITSGTDGLGVFFLLPTFIVGLIAALAIAYATQGRRRKFAFLLGIMFPVSLFLSFVVGLSFTEEKVAQRNGDQIIQALDQHRLTTGKYPANLSDLLPIYLPELPPLLLRDNTGWLYHSDGDAFTLEFKYYPDRRVIGSCMFSSQQPHWDCDLTDLLGRPVGFMQKGT